MRVPRVLAALVLTLLLAAPALAQEESRPILVKRTDDRDLAADLEHAAVATYSLYNLNPNEAFFVLVDAVEPEGWTWRPDANEFRLAPLETRLVNITFVPTSTPRTGVTIPVVIDLIRVETGVVTTYRDDVEVESLAPPPILGAFPNPLPEPLHNAYGTFLLDMLFWIAFAIGAILVSDPLVRILTTRASNQTTKEIIQKLRRPIFLFILFLGLARSFAILPRNGFTELMTKLLTAVGVAVFGLYVIYRTLDGILLYYQRTWASRTETVLDDVLVPALRKVGIVALYVIGIFVVLRNLGWDPTVLLGGAAIAGLVIAFAAQDTLSNLFSGLFLLLDRPFKEGDDIQLENGDVVRVDNIGLRTTRLYHSRRHQAITVPNNQLATKQIINMSAPDARFWLDVVVGASYGSSPDKVRRVLLDVAAQDERIVLDDPAWAPHVLLTTFADSSIDYTLRVAVKHYRDRWNIGSDIRFGIQRAFEREQIEIPFPQRTLWIRDERRA